VQTSGGSDVAEAYTRGEPAARGESTATPRGWKLAEIPQVSGWFVGASWERSIDRSRALGERSGIGGSRRGW
jgi:hypothetical protein